MKAASVVRPRETPIGTRKPDACAEYTFGCPVGTWRGRIDYRAWGNAKNLIIYATEIATGAKWWFSVWHLGSYRPHEAGPNFSTEVHTGDVLEMVSNHTAKGRPQLLRAVMIQASGAKAPSAAAVGDAAAGPPWD